MKKVIILKGLPASGKTTWTKTIINNHPGMYKRINKDDLRAMLDNNKWSGDNEKFILNVRDNLILLSLENGKNVIIDDTNLHEKHKNRIEALTQEYCNTHKIVEIETKFFDVDVGVCVRRDLKRQNSVGERVIRDMYDRYLKPKGEIYKPDTTKPKAIICDIDGTLAKMSGRSPYEWDKVDEDKVVDNIRDILHKHIDYSIILVSGRDSCSEDKTRKWLSNNKVPYDYLYMREEGNTEKDYVIKKRIFDENIRDKYNVLFVMDDRDQTVKMWRELGLTCLQVNEGNF